MLIKTEQWDIFEASFKGTMENNPFIDVKFAADFKFKNRIVKGDGFYDGNGIYKMRFMPDVQGKWSFVTTSNCPELNGLKGEFECTAPGENNHGPARVSNTYHFSYADGTSYKPFGTTCYAWTHQGNELEEQTLETLKTAPFNKLRMCVFPKHYDYNHNEPAYYPFEGSVDEGFNFDKFNPAFFQHLEKRIKNLMDLGIEADLIIFHPYDRWGFSKMKAEVDDRYLKYLIARLSSFRNIWWSLANEYDLMKEKDMTDWDRYFRIVQECDAYNHLRSVHNCRGFYDCSKPWVTHCSIQHSDIKKTAEWREIYKKPIVIDECCYEGNLSRVWGNLTAEEMVERFWTGFCLGGYVGHGETYVSEDDVIWWAKGGKLSGESPKRIAFLRKIIEEGSKDGLNIVNIGKDTRIQAGKDDEYILAYYGRSQPAYKDLSLSEENRYEIDIIDTWNMRIERVEGIFRGNCRIQLGTRPYLALRVRKINNYV